MVDPLSYFSFQSMLHDWCNKGCGMCYPVGRIVHIKEPVLLTGKGSPCSGDSRVCYLNGPIRHITINMFSASLNKTITPFLPIGTDLL